MQYRFPEGLYIYNKINRFIFNYFGKQIKYNNFKN